MSRTASPQHDQPAPGVAAGERSHGSRWSSLLVYLLAAGLIAGGIGMLLRARAASVPVAAALGARAPGFDLEVLGKPGERISLASLRGRPVLLVFNCGCKLCYEFNHAFVQAAPRLKGVEPVGIMMNHYSYAPAQLRNFRESTGFRGPLLMDNKSQTTLAYHSTDCPRVWLIDRNGIIRYHNKSNQEPPEQILKGLFDAYAKL